MTLKEWRERTGMTKTQLAKALGVILKRPIKSQHITAWEGKSMPGWDVGEAISTLTGNQVTAASVH